jgi:hypothetical protein
MIAPKHEYRPEHQDLSAQAVVLYIGVDAVRGRGRHQLFLRGVESSHSSNVGPARAASGPGSWAPAS